MQTFGQEITELENELSKLNALLKNAVDGLTEYTNVYGITGEKLPLLALNVANINNRIFAVKCDLNKVKHTQAQALHERNINIIINLSELAKDINAKARKK